MYVTSKNPYKKTLAERKKLPLKMFDKIHEMSPVLYYVGSNNPTSEVLLNNDALPEQTVVLDNNYFNVEDSGQVNSGQVNSRQVNSEQINSGQLDYEQVDPPLTPATSDSISMFDDESDSDPA